MIPHEENQCCHNLHTEYNIVLYVSCFEGLPPGITSGSKGQRWPLFVYASMSEFLPLLWFQKQSYKYTIKQNILLNQTKNH